MDNKDSSAKRKNSSIVITPIFAFNVPYNGPFVIIIVEMIYPLVGRDMDSVVMVLVVSPFEG